jgi:hypothetical protein
MRLHLRSALAFLLLALAPDLVSGKDKAKRDQTPQQDQISVDAHIAVPGGPVVRFVATKHYDRTYVYVEHGPGQPTTLLDVSSPGKPLVVSQLDLTTAATNLVAVAGTAALSSSAVHDQTNVASQTIRLMDFSDPKNPKVTRQFEGVTAVEKLSGGVILLANPEGVWVLSQHLADDPAVQERYAKKVIYGEN